MITIRLLRLHALSRRSFRALLLLASTAFALCAVEPWTRGSGEFARLLPILLTAVAAGVIASSSASPFGEVERTGCRLPLLRLTVLCALVLATAAAYGLARPGDALVLVRNLAGLTGLALLTACVVGGSLGWTIPLAYTVLCGGAIDLRDESVWTWPTLPAADAGAMQIAVLLFGVGLAAVVVYGVRDQPA